MSAAATIAHVDLTPEMAEILRAGAADHLGICCRPSQVRTNWLALRDCERAGYLRFLNMEQPWITDAGRRAIGAPTQIEADRAKLALLCANARKPLIPAKRHDPRTDFDYRSYKKMVCTLVIRQPDSRINPATVRVGRTLTSDPQFLGGGNSIIQPESSGRFVVAVVPEWMTRFRWKDGVPQPAIFTAYPPALDEIDPAFSDAERETWTRLRQVCHSINSRIRNSGRKQREKLRFGESA